MTSFDAIVIGGGHNGLVAAAAARRRPAARCWCWKPTEELGGAARTRGIRTGLPRLAVAHLLNRLHPGGGRRRWSWSATVSTLAGAGARHGRAFARTARRWCCTAPMARRSTALRAAEAAGLGGAARAADPLCRHPEAVPGAPTAATRRHGACRDGSALGMTALALQPARQGGHARLPAHAPDERRRRRSTSISTDDRLKGLLAFDAVLGSHLGPRSPTSLLGLYYRLAGEIGGSAGRADRAAAAAWAPSSQPSLRRPRAAGVDHPHGSAGRTHRWSRRAAPSASCSTTARRSRAATIVSAINPRTTFLDLVGPRELDTGFVRKVEQYPHEGQRGQAASGARPAAANSPASTRPSHRGPAGHRAVGRSCRARLQPGQVWRVLARAGDGDHAAEPRRSVARAGRRLRAFGRSCSTRPTR